MTDTSTPQRSDPARERLRPAVEPSPRWVRVAFGEQAIASSRRALLLLQYGGPGRLPT
jgi:hypothetical protein